MRRLLFGSSTFFRTPDSSPRTSQTYESTDYSPQSTPPLESVSPPEPPSLIAHRPDANPELAAFVQKACADEKMPEKEPFRSGFIHDKIKLLLKCDPHLLTAILKLNACHQMWFGYLEQSLELRKPGLFLRNHLGEIIHDYNQDIFDLLEKRPPSIEWDTGVRFANLKALLGVNDDAMFALDPSFLVAVCHEPRLTIVQRKIVKMHYADEAFEIVEKLVSAGYLDYATLLSFSKQDPTMLMRLATRNPSEVKIQQSRLQIDCPL